METLPRLTTCEILGPRQTPKQTKRRQVSITVMPGPEFSSKHFFVGHHGLERCFRSAPPLAPKRMKRRAAFSSARRFKSYFYFLLLLRTSYLSSVPGVPLLSALPLGRAVFGLNNPSPSRIEKLHPHRIAVAMQRLAVRHSSQRTKLSRARRERQWFAFFPSSRAHYTRSARAHVFCKCRFRSLPALMTIEHHWNLHQDPALVAVERK